MHTYQGSTNGIIGSVGSNFCQVVPRGGLPNSSWERVLYHGARVLYQSINACLDFVDFKILNLAVGGFAMSSTTHDIDVFGQIRVPAWKKPAGSSSGQREISIFLWVHSYVCQKNGVAWIILKDRTMQGLCCGWRRM